ncbi:MAG: transcriptional regulator [Novosphingobium sp.]|nr:transcriptional regulator [Novosphingobium sp.]
MNKLTDNAPFAFAGLDRLFHERARLGIVTCLAGNPDGLAFSELKRLCGLTDGNLSRHLAALDEAGYVVISKKQAGRRLKTTCRLTPLGRERFIAYLEALESALREGTRAAMNANKPLTATQAS